MYILTLIVSLLIQFTSQSIVARIMGSIGNDLQNGWYYRTPVITEGPIPLYDLVDLLYKGEIDQSAFVYHSKYSPQMQPISDLEHGTVQQRQLYSQLMQTGTSFTDISLQFYRNKACSSDGTATGSYGALPDLSPSVWLAIFFVMRMFEPQIQFSGTSHVIGGKPDLNWGEYNIHIDPANRYDTPVGAAPEFILEYARERNTLTIYFAGTNVNWERKLMDVHIDTDYKHMQYGPLLIHRGVAQKIFDPGFQLALLAEIQSIKRKNKGSWDCKTLQLIIAGHSLGGGYALVLYLLLYYVYPQMMEGITRGEFPIQIAHDGFEKQLFPQDVTLASCVTFGAVLTISRQSVPYIPPEVSMGVINIFNPRDPVPRLLGGGQITHANAAVGQFFVLPFIGIKRTDESGFRGKLRSLRGKKLPYGRLFLKMDPIALQECINNGNKYVMQSLVTRGGKRSLVKDAINCHFLQTYSDAIKEALTASGLCVLGEYTSAKRLQKKKTDEKPKKQKPSFALPKKQKPSFALPHPFV